MSVCVCVCVSLCRCVAVSLCLCLLGVCWVSGVGSSRESPGGVVLVPSYANWFKFDQIHQVSRHVSPVFHTTFDRVRGFQSRGQSCGVRTTSNSVISDKSPFCTTGLAFDGSTLTR
eukprot:1250849-Rhodomonas_salina.1